MVPEKKFIGEAQDCANETRSYDLDPSNFFSDFPKFRIHLKSKICGRGGH